MKKMDVIGRFLMLVSGLLLAAVNFTRLWYIDLVAPQYPEGLRLVILTKGWGDLGQKKIIDTINHYVGMHPLPQHIPEFDILPFVFWFFAITAIILAIWYNRKLIWTWFILYAAFGIIAMADFYKWLYKYGHELDPHAALRIDPFTPPLIGKKVLLNFTVWSLPDIGGWFAIIAGVLVFLVIVLDWLYVKE
jgi:copper chaperone NosL